MKNPYTGYTEKQHCRHVYAMNAKGREVFITSRSAVQWCAKGVLIDQEIQQELRIQFDDFLTTKMKWPVTYLNDFGWWTFAQFRKAWTDFMRSRKKAK